MGSTDAAPEILPALGRRPLARADVDRGSEVRAREGWLDTVWDLDQARVLRLHGGRVPVVGGDLVLTRPEGPRPEEAIYLGRSTASDTPDSPATMVSGDEPSSGDDAAPLELVLIVAHTEAEARAGLESGEAGGRAVSEQDIAWVGLREVAAALTDRDAGVFAQAVAIANWHARHTHCPRCGALTRSAQSGWVRVCPEDGSEHFPRTDPAIIVTVTDRADRVLLGNNAAWGPGRYSTLAGFVEPGESLEAAVAREVLEESHVPVHSAVYLGSQPWPFPQSLMLGFTAVTDHPDLAAADQEEIAEVRWFTREELAELAATGEITLPGSSSISRALLEHWYGGALPEPTTVEN